MAKKLTISGKWFNSENYGLTDDGLINYEEIENKLYTTNPRVLVVGASAYSRIIDFERIRKFLDKYNNYKWNEYLKEHPEDKNNEIAKESNKCYLMVDMAHIAGLVATGLHPSPLPYADVVTSTTHKTLRGPRGGLILTNNEDIAKKIDKAIFPGCQGGPLEHVIAAKAVCFYEANTEEFKKYQNQVLDNSKAMALTFQSLGVKVISSGTDNHLMLLDLRDKDITGRELEDKLAEINIIVNKNKVVNDPRSAKETSGIRIGTPCITSRGATTNDCARIASVICQVINKPNYDKDLLKSIVNDIVSYWK